MLVWNVISEHFRNAWGPWLISDSIMLAIGLLFLWGFVRALRTGKSLGRPLYFYRDENPTLYWASQVVVGAGAAIFILVSMVGLLGAFFGHCTPTAANAWSCAF